MFHKLRNSSVDTQIAIQFENMVYVGPSLRKAEQLFVAGLSNTF